jgi:hypothetical protein
VFLITYIPNKISISQELLKRAKVAGNSEISWGHLRKVVIESGGYVYTRLHTIDVGYGELCLLHMSSWHGA